MRQTFGHVVALGIFAVIGLLCGCNRAGDVLPKERNIVLPDGVTFQDKTFHSQALGTDTTYRVIMPAVLPANEPVRILYLLHGNGGSFREWSKDSSIAQLATLGFVLVMPEGHSSYFMNPASGRGGNYEDFITADLRADAESGLRRPINRVSRSIVGVSMGGFAAIVIGLKHPDLYGFAGAMSPPVDYPRRKFTLRRWGQSMAIRSIFGPEGSVTRSASDPFVLVKEANKDMAPFVFLSVGDVEGLREPVLRFEALLRAKGIAHEFHVVRGGHDWQNWNSELPTLLTSLQGRRS
jgi:S-formylglutathione hydrolase FrmB